MATPSTYKGHQLQVLIGDGASPEVFTARCLINTSRELALEATTIDTALPDCDSPANPNWIHRDKDTLSASVSGAGRIHVSDVDFFTSWFTSRDPKNVQIRENIAGGNTASGAFHLTRFRRTGNDKETVEAEIELMSDGEVTFAPNV